jgi:hypothetical protein
LTARFDSATFGPSVVARRALKHDSLELGEAVAAEPQDGLEALAAELACVECPAELIETRALLLEDLITRGLNQDQVPRPPFAVSEPNEAVTLAWTLARESTAPRSSTTRSANRSGSEAEAPTTSSRLPGE